MLQCLQRCAKRTLEKASDAGMITYHGAGQRDVEAYLSKPRTEESRPAIVVIHEIWGLVDHIRILRMDLPQRDTLCLRLTYSRRTPKCLLCSLLKTCEQRWVSCRRFLLKGGRTWVT